MTETTAPKSVAEAINHVMATVGYVQKKGVNEFHRYKFAAVGDLLAKVQPAMAEAGLIIIQDEAGHELIEGGAVMTATYVFKLAHRSGEVWTIEARHTGMAAARTSKGTPDDKALNKCHTAARKYFLLSLFQIPTGEMADPDMDGDVPVEAAHNGNGTKSSAQAKRDGDWERLTAQVDACDSVEALQAWWKISQPQIKALPRGWPEELAEYAAKRKHSIMDKAAAA